ncbi:unnamed protein product [Ambrosiozyma monospora]|uniref:Unnamed protein product n=1 Tax=Ambrosiozyma monospora TaxID=43982 RepID=A0A9W6Z1T8_AMBMO|nr:unnamed protein product [Ambrosiozyma monospora]
MSDTSDEKQIQKQDFKSNKTDSDAVIDLEQIPTTITTPKGIQTRELIPEYADEFNPDGLYMAFPEDKLTYRSVKGNIPYSAFLMLIVEFAERGSYYGTQGILTNFIMRPLPDGSTTGSTHTDNQSAGALDMGLPVANAFVMLLQFLAYVAPLIGGYLADAKLGKFKAIMIGVWIGLVSHILFVIAGLPPVIKHGNSALAPTVIAIISLAFATGFIKPNLLPLLLDQYPYRANVLKKLPTGEIIYMDRDKSMENVTLIFYWSINIGAFFQLATTYAARDIGYWLAFLTPGLMYLLVCIFMLLVGRHISHPPPTGSIIARFLKVLDVCFRGNFLARIKNGEFWEFSYPSNMESRGELYFRKKSQSPITWTDQDVRDYRSTIGQCLMFLYWIVFNLNDTGLSTALNAQAGAMITKNVPNDLFNNFNQITIIVLIPILDFLIYPAIAKMGWNFKSVHKISFGFFLGGLSSMLGAILQWRVYETSPCGYYASDCDAGVSTITACWHTLEHQITLRV